MASPPHVRDLEQFLFACLSRLDRYGRRLAARPSEAETLRKMRVTTRRLREGLSLLEEVSGGGIRTLIKPVRRLTRLLGTYRSIDASLAILRKEFARTHPAAVRLASAKLRDRRLASQAELFDGLESFRPKRIAKRLRKALKRAAVRANRRWAEGVRRLLERRSLKLRQEGGIRGKISDENLHRLRTDIKRLRYDLEILVRDPGGGRAARILDALESCQDLLGRWSDARTLVEHLEEVLRERDVATSPERLQRTWSLVRAVRERKEQAEFRIRVRLQQGSLPWKPEWLERLTEELS